MGLPNDLVRVRIGDVEKNLGRAYAESTEGVEILEDEPVRNRDGSLRGTTRHGGRPLKPKTTVATATAQRTTAPQPGPTPPTPPTPPAVTPPAPNQ